MSQIHFFCLLNDQKEIFSYIEGLFQLKYILFGNFRKKEEFTKVKIYYSGLELPNLGLASGTQPMNCDMYLAIRQEDDINYGKRKDIYGVERVTIDQRNNPGSIVIQLGGMWNNEAIISGRVSTVHKTKEAIELMRAFRLIISKNKKVKAYYVGNDAYAYFMKGGRLACASIASPKEYDLRL